MPASPTAQSDVADRICVNCRHYVYLERPAKFASGHQCRRLPLRDLVTGEPLVVECERARKDDADCGSSGRYFVARLVGQTEVAQVAGQ